MTDFEFICMKYTNKNNVKLNGNNLQTIHITYAIRIKVFSTVRILYFFDSFPKLKETVSF